MKKCILQLTATSVIGTPFGIWSGISDRPFTCFAAKCEPYQLLNLRTYKGRINLNDRAEII